MGKCRDCRGNGSVLCPVCGGTMKDPRNNAKECGYCNGRGHVECPACNGTGDNPYDN